MAQTPKYHPLIRLSCVMLLVFWTACALQNPHPTKEPSIIIIRNLSGIDLATVSLRQANQRANASVRYGAVSPVPNGVTQSVVRATDPQPLSPQVILAWIDSTGTEHQRDLSLYPLLGQSSGTRGEALVFEIGPAEVVRVTLEFVSF